MAFEDGVFPTFYDKRVENKRKSEKEGYPVFDEPRLYVKIMVPNSVDVVDRPASQADIQRFPKSYEAYKTGSEPPESGYPVEQWAQVSADDVAILKAVNIKTVEQLADVPDSGLHRLGPGAHGLKNRAVKFLKDRSTNEELHARIEELERKLEKAESTVSEEPKRKPKRLKVATR